jgi:hypothetical protein
MSSSTTLPRQSLRPDEQPISQYRSISRAAVAAVGIGLASAVVLINPILAPVAIVAVLMAVVALRTIAQSQGQVIGQGAAILGLCLATLFLGWGISRHLSRQSHLAESAQQLGDMWLGLIQEGKLKEALQLRQMPASRITAADALAAHYEKDPEAAKELQQFGSQLVVKSLQLLGDRADLRFEGLAAVFREGFDDRFVLKYSYADAPSPGGRHMFWVHLNRRVDGTTKRGGWQVDGASEHPPQGSE